MTCAPPKGPTRDAAAACIDNIRLQKQQKPEHLQPQSPSSSLCRLPLMYGNRKVKPVWEQASHPVWEHASHPVWEQASHHAYPTQQG